VFASTGGRVLGFDFDAAGRLIAADAVKGLLAIGADRKAIVLADKVDGDPDPLCRRGGGREERQDLFQRRVGPLRAGAWGGTFEAAVLDIVEQACTGRILEHDPATAHPRRRQGFSFANGVRAERRRAEPVRRRDGKYRVWKIAVAGRDLDVGKVPLPADAAVVLDNLPGYPTTSCAGQDGRIWLGFSGPRSAQIDAMSDKPFLRELTLRLPRSPLAAAGSGMAT
jgi:sugar lactone lactonase YvrE